MPNCAGQPSRRPRQQFAREALLECLKASLAAALALGIKRGRLAYPLGCGLGKTQAIVAFCTAAHELHLDEVSVGRVLKELGFAHVSPRPRHPEQDRQAIEAFKKTSPRAWQRR